MVASACGRLDAVKYLLSHGAKVMSKDLGGSTPLHKGFRSEHKEVVQYLLFKGANPAARDTEGQTPLLAAARWSGPSGDTLKCLISLEEVWATLDIPDARGRTPLWWAAQCGASQLVETLLEAGADPTIADVDGKTPLDATRNQMDCQTLKVSGVEASMAF